MLKKVFVFMMSAMATNCSAAPGDIADEGVDAVQQPVANRPLYRRFAGKNGDWDHLYTTINGEGTAYRSEGILGYCEPSYTTHGQIATVFLHRMWSVGAPNDHFYTTDESEAWQANQHGYAFDNVMPECWVWPAQIPGTCPIHRMWSSVHSDHLYTNSDFEYSSLTNAAPQRYAPENWQAWFMVSGRTPCGS